jgi:hypothetical protein
MTGARRLRTFRSTVIEVAEVGLFFVYLALVVAELELVDRPLQTDSLSGYAVPAVVLGAQLAYNHRRSGRWAMLAWGVAAGLGALATFAIFALITRAMGPSVRAQAWLPPVLAGIAATIIVVVVVQRVLGESTTEGRRIAVGEVLGFGLIPFGIWLATREVLLLYALGAVLALAGPILLWLLGQRRKQHRAAGQGAQP